MIVESMNIDEIRNELRKDYPIVFRKAYYVSIAESKTLKLKKDEELTIYYQYYSKHKNYWIYRITYTKKKNYISLINYNNDSRGLNAIVASENVDNILFFFNGHFFKRYNERRKLNLTGTFEILCAFLGETSILHAETIEELGNGMNKIFCAAKSGMMLGMENTISNSVRINTFISNDLMKKSQQELAEQKRTEFEMDKDFFRISDIQVP